MAGPLLRCVLSVILTLSASYAERSSQQAAQSQSGGEIRLAGIQVKGIHRYTAEEVTRLTALEIGKPATAADFTAAANRLAATGLFNSVKYTYTTTARQTTVTFDVEEAAWTVPVVLDNFVWVADDQLTAAIREAVPSYDGTAPVNVGAADFVQLALQNILKARSIPGRVDVSTLVDLKTKAPRYVFSVRDPSPKICALHVAGASAIPERELLAPLASISGGEYSRLFLTEVSNGTLMDIYHRRGHWRAAFAVPTAALDTCPGVAVTLNVNEGPPFAWDHAEWIGTSALQADTLNRLLSMKPGEAADVSKIETGLRAVSGGYGQQGYILQRAAYVPRLDDAARKAVFQITVDEGPQFHMGTLEFAGLKESDATTLAKRWRLKPGDVFDASYEKKFEFEELSPLRTSAGGRAHTEMKLDENVHVVNLTVVFK